MTSTKKCFQNLYYIPLVPRSMDFLTILTKKKKNRIKNTMTTSNSSQVMTFESTDVLCAIELHCVCLNPGVSFQIYRKFSNNKKQLFTKAKKTPQINDCCQGPQFLPCTKQAIVQFKCFILELLPFDCKK